MEMCPGSTYKDYKLDQEEPRFAGFSEILGQWDAPLIVYQSGLVAAMISFQSTTIS